MRAYDILVNHIHHIRRFWISPSVPERYSRSNLKLSEVAPNFVLFFVRNFRGEDRPQNLYPNYHACLVARHVEKVREVTPPSHEVIGAHTLNFMPMFKCFF